MTKRDLFILLIKLFGLFSLITSLFAFLPNNISFAMMQIDLFSIVWIIVAIAVVVGLFVVLIFKADKVVRLLKLDQGFDEDRIELGNLKANDIVKLGAFIIGGFLIIDNIPTFLSHSLFAFKSDLIGFEYSIREKFNWAVCGLNLIIGFLLLTNYDFVAKLLKLKKTENE